jgi:hypothetical protein
MLPVNEYEKDSKEETNHRGTTIELSLPFLHRIHNRIFQHQSEKHTL